MCRHRPAHRSADNPPGCDFDERVIFCRRGAEPAGMAHRGTPLARLGIGTTFRGFDLGDIALPLAIGGELVLPLQFELEFQTLDSRLSASFSTVKSETDCRAASN